MLSKQRLTVKRTRPAGEYRVRNESRLRYGATAKTVPIAASTANIAFKTVAVISSVGRIIDAVRALNGECRAGPKPYPPLDALSPRVLGTRCWEWPFLARVAGSDCDGGYRGTFAL